MELHFKLPSKIKVRRFRGESGVFIAELPDFDVFTEADNIWELDAQINDLIFTFFDTPEELQKQIRYVQEEPSQKPSDIEKLLFFQKFISSDLEQAYAK